MLHVYHLELVQRRTTVSELAEQIGFAVTTLDRWLKMLEVDGLVHRRMDPNDPVSVRVSLSLKGLEAMDGFFSESP
jgi:DNA-binding MarR family transcriptional regulator